MGFCQHRPWTCLKNPAPAGGRLGALTTTGDGYRAENSCQGVSAPAAADIAPPGAVSRRTHLGCGPRYDGIASDHSFTAGINPPPGGTRGRTRWDLNLMGSFSRWLGPGQHYSYGEGRPTYFVDWLVVRRPICQFSAN